MPGQILPTRAAGDVSWLDLEQLAVMSIVLSPVLPFRLEISTNLESEFGGDSDVAKVE